MKRDVILVGCFIVALFLIQGFTDIPATNLIGWLMFYTLGHWVLFAMAIGYIVILLRRANSGYMSDRGKAIGAANTNIANQAKAKTDAAEQKRKTDEANYYKAEKELHDKIDEHRRNSGMFPTLEYFFARFFGRDGGEPAESSYGPRGFLDFATPFIVAGFIGICVVSVLAVMTIKASPRLNSTMPKTDNAVHNAIAFCTADGTGAYIISVSSDEQNVSSTTLTTQCYALAPGDTFENNSNFRGVLYTKVHKADGTFVLLNNGYLFTEVP